MHVSIHVVRALQLSQFTCTTTLGYILQIAAIATTYISRQLWVTSSLYIIIKYFMCMVVSVCSDSSSWRWTWMWPTYFSMTTKPKSLSVRWEQEWINGSIILSQPSLYIYTQAFNGIDLVEDKIRIPVSHSEFHTPGVHAPSPSHQRRWLGLITCKIPPIIVAYDQLSKF